MIPHTLHVLARYISLLFTWGSVHQTTLYLDRLEQLAKFSRSDYWISKHQNLSAFIRVTLQKSVAKIPAPLSCSPLKHELLDSNNEYMSEYLELERYRTAETEMLKAAAVRSNQVVQTNGVSSVEDGVYPVFSSSLTPSHLARLILLQLELSWSIAPPSHESSVEYHHSLKTSRDSWISNKSSKKASPTYTPAELDALSRAWLSMLSDCQSQIPGRVEEESKPKPKVEEESKPKPAARRGRSRNNSNSKAAVKQTTTRPTTRRQAGKRQAASKKSQVKQTETTDHVQFGNSSVFIFVSINDFSIKITRSKRI